MTYKNPARRAAYQRAYAKRRAKRPSRPSAARLRAKRDLAPFVAIDSEGCSVGEPIALDGKTYRLHRSFLWGACEAAGEPEWLYDPATLNSETIIEWLLDLPARFACGGGAQPIFVSFAFSYDVAQILRDVSFERAWEVQHGRQWGKPETPRNSRRIALWRNYGFQYLRGKQLTLYGFAPNAPTWVGPPDNRKLNYDRRIRIYDTFGFFQSSFLAALKGFPDALSADEYAIVKQGKTDRLDFDASREGDVKRYTRLELRGLASMMTALRKAMADENVRVLNWHGAGSIASALLRREKTAEALREARSRDLEPWQDAAHHAYFGGRIELIMQGRTREPLYSYDLASAYPAAAVTLPSTAEGLWIERAGGEPTGASVLSMFLVHADLPGPYAHGAPPFYPFPYRTRAGGILFPPRVHGWYMRDEVLAALAWRDRFGGSIVIDKALLFVGETAERPFHFIHELFEYRRSLPKTDIREKVIKLGINSVYGKLAQAVGFGKAPKHASPVHAAAITAWTRARLITAALSDPYAIVMFATDGIISTRPLALDIPPVKTLGAWEASVLPEGGSFIQSGVYSASQLKDRPLSKTRGFRPSGLDMGVDDVLNTVIPKLMARDQAAYSYPYHHYMTLGLATASRASWAYCGAWVDGRRDLLLNAPSNKRDVPPEKTLRRKRDRELIATIPKDGMLDMEWDEETGRPLLSHPSTPEWLDPDYQGDVINATEQDAVWARHAEEEEDV